jgi:tripartite ATP-independent transporter DctM subunit
MLTPPIVGIIGIIILVLLIVWGVPIAVSSAVVGFLGCVVLIGFKPALGVMYLVPVDKVATYSLSVIPLFILMGILALHGGIGHELYGACVKWLGRLPGGLAMATTAANALFGACSGSSLAAAATFTKLSMPEMSYYNYHPKLSTGVIAASGTMAAMILVAGVIPGILGAFIYMMSIYVRSSLDPKLGPAVLTKVSLKEKLLALRYLLSVAVVFIVLLGGIYLGIFSPTEGGAAGAFVVFLIVLFRRRLSWSNLMLSLKETVTTSAMIFFIIVGAMVFAQFLAVSRLPNFFIDMVISRAVHPLLVVLMILLIYVFLGTFLDAVAMMALTLPILFPLIESLGINGVWFGIMVIKMTEIALITPPLGLNVYVVKGLAPKETRLEDIFMGIFHFPNRLCNKGYDPKIGLDLNI